MGLSSWIGKVSWPLGGKKTRIAVTCFPNWQNSSPLTSEDTHPSCRLPGVLNGKQWPAHVFVSSCLCIRHPILCLLWLFLNIRTSPWAMTSGIASKLLIIMTWAYQHMPGIPALYWRSKFKARLCNELQTSLSCIVRPYSKISMYVHT